MMSRSEFDRWCRMSHAEREAEAERQLREHREKNPPRPWKSCDPRLALREHERRPDEEDDRTFFARLKQEGKI